jgi:transcriptional regulator GlxA family with amidase domain
VTVSSPRTIPVCVILPPGALLLDVAGPADVLRRANIEQSAVRFQVRYHAAAPEVTSSVGLTLAALEPLPEAVPEDAIVIVSGDAETLMRPEGESPRDPAAGRERRAIVQWLKTSVRPDHLLVCICSGALFAAEAGLLDGYACTTHHTDCADLARIAPLAKVLENRLFVEDRNRLTSAGITAGIDLMLHLVSRLTDPLVALRVAQHLVVYFRRSGSDPQASPWFSGRNHMHRAVHRAQDAVMAAPAAPWTLEGLADIAGTSPRHLSRLFNEHTGMSVPGYVGQLRVVLAGDFLRHSSLDLEGIAHKVGFASARQMRRVWAQFHAEPPSHIRRPRQPPPGDDLPRFSSPPTSQELT